MEKNREIHRRGQPTYEGTSSMQRLQDKNEMMLPLDGLCRWDRQYHELQQGCLRYAHQ